MATTVVKKRGGPRPGAGRPVGSKTLKTRVAAQKLVEAQRHHGGLELPPGTTPLEVMVEAMRVAYRVSGPLGAFPFAEKAAPYIHAKIGSLELKNPEDPKTGKVQPFRFEVELVKPKK
jgi:hypothetical protein